MYEVNSVVLECMIETNPTVLSSGNVTCEVKVEQFRGTVDQSFIVSLIARDAELGDILVERGVIGRKIRIVGKLASYAGYHTVEAEHIEFTPGKLNETEEE